MSGRAVCDASAGFDLLLAGAAGNRAAAALAGHELHVPAFFPLEVCAAARSRVRSGQVSAPRGELIVRDLARFPAVTWAHEAALLLRGWELRENVTTYDAAYVALAERLGATLVTADTRLAAAARRFATCEVVDTTA